MSGLSLSGDSDREGVYALAREIAERIMGMPAYEADDETWAEAMAEAEATYESLKPKKKSPLQEAIDRARHPDPVEFINVYNEARRRRDA